MAFRKMVPEVKDKWTRALRSGLKHQRAKDQSYLRRGDEYSALGVLCDLYVKEHYGQGVRWKIVGGSLGLRSLHGQISTLPKEVCDWAGVEFKTPLVKVGGVAVGQVGGTWATLTDLQERVTWEELAQVIEENL